jgi:branched-chain amino acid transport system permease protein
MRRLQAIWLVLLLIAAIVFPLVFSNPTVTTIAFITVYFAISATSWNIFAGYTGYIALGHAVFFGTGAYALALMCQDWHIQGDTLGGYLPFALLPICGLIAGAIAVPVGAIALRARGHAFVVITIAIFFIFQLLAYNLKGLTNGSTGLSLPIPPWGGYVYNLPFIYVGLGILLLAFATSWFVRNSKYGLGLLAIRDDEDRARGLGVRTGPSKLVAFVISAFFVGMAGGLWAYFIESIRPEFAFNALFDVALALTTFLGGAGTLGGPLLGTLLLVPAQQYFALQYGESGIYLIVYGALFLVVLLLLPEGIIPTLRKRWIALRARGRPAGPAVPGVAAAGAGAGTSAGSARMTGGASPPAGGEGTER